MALIYNFNQRLLLKLKAILFERFEYKQKKLPDQICKIKKKKIPNIVYQTWPTKKLPWRLANHIREFRDLNKDHSFLIFTDINRDKYMKTYWGNHEIYKIYRDSIFQPSKADIWRYCILYERGGFYFDIKSGCDIPLSKLKISKGAVISYEPFLTMSIPEIEYIKNDAKAFNVIQNWGFGFSKNHALLKLIIDNICKYSSFIRGKEFANPKSAILAFTGPGMLTKTYREYIKSENSVIKMNGINFFGKGLYELKGAKYRFKNNKSYSDFENSKILQ